MPAPVTSRALAAVGLLALVPIALGLLRGSLGIDVAAVRAGVLLVALTVADKVLLPLARSLVGAPVNRE